jgi:hypothetical protein
MASKDLEAVAAWKCTDLGLFAGYTGGSPSVQNNELVSYPMSLSEERLPLRLSEKTVDVSGDDTLQRSVWERQSKDVGLNSWHFR